MPLIFLQDFFAREAINRIADHSAGFSNQPLFLFLSFTAPHTPLQAPPELVNLVHFLRNLKIQCFSNNMTLLLITSQNSYYPRNTVDL